MARRKLSSLLKELDEISKALSGRDIPSWAKQAFEELRQAKPSEELPETKVEVPYAVLGLDPNCIPSDIVSRYRALAKKFHPDGTHPNVERFKQITAAYEEICLERGIR